MPGRRVRIALLLALAPGLLGAALIRWAPTEGLERNGLDMLFRWRGPAAPPESVCVVAIDIDSFSAYELDPRKVLWPRELHAQLIRILHEEGAKAVAFDVLFEDPGDAGPDTEFEWALEDTGFVVLGASVEQLEDPRFRRAQSREPFAPFAEAAAALGQVNLPRDPDDVIRSAWLMPNGKPGLALAAVETAAGAVSARDRESILIDFYGPPRTVKTVSLYQALDPAQYLPDGFFRDKIVFVGASEQAGSIAEKDAFPTPFRGAGGQTTFGVEIHATIAGNLLEGREIRLLPIWAETLMLLLLPVLAVWAFVWLRPLYGAGALLVWMALPWLGGYVAFTRESLWVPTVIPSAIQLPLAYTLSVLWYYLTTVRERERVKRAFSRYLSPETARQVAEDPSALNLGGEEIEATAMFTDIAGFTSVAESMGAKDTAAMLNRYFSEATGHVFDTGGTLVKYIGDAVFAIWNAPVRVEDHAARACRAAAALAQMDASHEKDAADDDPAKRLRTRIGVHTGPMLVGNLGSAQRFDYTAIGDAVNLAARIEGINKMFGTRAMVSGDTLAAAGDGIPSRRLGRIRVVGRAEPVELHELTDAPADPDFERGLAAFERAAFDEARTAFASVLERRGGDDGPSSYYVGLCERLEREGVNRDGWDGVIDATSK